MTQTRVFTNFIVCLIGVVLSCYAYYVEKLKSEDKNYKALCDISSHVSCSKVFHSPYGRGFGTLQRIAGERSALVQPNSVYGIIAYTLYAVLVLFGKERTLSIRLVLNVLTIAMSVYLGYILFFVLYDFCVVCVSTYVLNTILFVLSILEYRAGREANVATTKLSGSDGLSKKVN